MDNSFVNSLGSSGAGFIMDSAKSVVNAGLQDSLNERANKRTLENMVIGNKMARANFMDSAMLQKMGAIRAGMSPLGSYQSTNITPSSPSAPSGAFVPGGGSANDIVNAQRLQNETAITESEVDKNKADAELARATAKRTGYESDFLGQTLGSRVKLTNKENANKYYIEGYMEEHPELLNAVASAQNILNDKITSETNVNKKQLSVLDSIIKKNKSDISLNDAKKALTYVQTKFTKGQTEYFKNKDFRENYQNIGWLLNEMKNVASSNDANKDSKLAMLKECLGYVSGERLQSNDIQAKKDMQFIDLNVKQDIANKDRKVAQQRADASSKIADAQDLKVKSDIVFKTIDVLIKVFDRIFSALSSDEIDKLDNMFEESGIMDGINATEIFH